MRLEDEGDQEDEGGSGILLEGKGRRTVILRPLIVAVVEGGDIWRREEYV